MDAIEDYWKRNYHRWTTNK